LNKDSGLVKIMEHVTTKSTVPNLEL
jgi:hypothetical protein